MVCPNCKADIPVGSKFCVQCGTVLEGGSPPSLAIVPSTSSAERRQLTVMFCDLVGSTGIASKLDAEDWRTWSTPTSMKCRRPCPALSGMC